MVKIIPAILTNDIKEIEEKLARSEGIVDRVQIDVIDGQFAASRTIDPSFVRNIETDINLDFHLMTKEPVDWVEKAVTGGADRIIGQIEKMTSQVDFVGKVQSVGLSVGLAIDIETPVSSFDPVVLTNLDVVLVMAVKAGFGGQKFDKRALAKIRWLDETRVRDDTPYKICVDGGETLETVDDVRVAGVDEIVVGKRIFQGDLVKNIKKFTGAAYE